jgi:hypothetical protein
MDNITVKDSNLTPIVDALLTGFSPVLKTMSKIGYGVLNMNLTPAPTSHFKCRFAQNDNENCKEKLFTRTKDIEVSFGY